MAKDSRLTEIEQDREEQLNEIDQQYGEMISNSQQYYDQQIEASKQYAEQQQQIQQEKNDFELQQIQQQKDEAQQAHIKEQSGAYVDWQKQSNRYGVNAEQMAAAGLSRTGFSESAQVSMYNAYQNRVATAQAALTKANTAYDNAMTNARLQNNALLAEIAAQAYREQAELALQAFQYENSLLMQQESEKRAWTGIFDTRYAQMLDQINTERALAEQQRQASLAHARWQQEQQAAKEQQQAILDALYGDGKGTNPPAQSHAYVGEFTPYKNIGYSDAVLLMKNNGKAGRVNSLYSFEQWKQNGSPNGSYEGYLSYKLSQFGITRSMAAEYVVQKNNYERETTNQQRAATARMVDEVRIANPQTYDDAVYLLKSWGMPTAIPGLLTESKYRAVGGNAPYSQYLTSYIASMRQYKKG